MNDARAAGAPDFVDRLVVKAFGGADVAAARVPSTYESPRPRVGPTLGAPQAERIDEDVRLGEDAVDDDGRESHDRRRQPRAAKTSPADGSRPLAANAAEEDARATEARPRRRRSSVRGDAVRGRDAGSRSARAMDGDDTAGALVPAPASTLSSLPGSPLGDRPDGDAAAPIARSAFDVAASHPTGSDGQATTSPVAADAAHVVQPSARLRASLDPTPFTRETGDEDGAASNGRRATRETPAREGVLMPVAHDVAQHVADDRAGWREPGSRSASAEASAMSSDVTVNVTIGRVDVRAVQAPASVERPARTRGAQPVALDDYLAQRGAAR